MTPGTTELSDIVALPTRNETRLVDRATRLFASRVKLFSYHVDSEERLDVWFRRSTVGDEEFGLSGEEAVSTFRWGKRQTGEETFGPWVQIINLSYEFFPVTVVHELSHLVDRYHTPPRTTWTSASDTFHALYRAYSRTDSAYILTKIASGDFPLAIAPDGSLHELFDRDEAYRAEMRAKALGMLRGHEVFARCLTAYVFYRAKDEASNPRDQALVNLYLRRVSDARNVSTGCDLSETDFEIVKGPMQELLETLGWNCDD